MWKKNKNWITANRESFLPTWFALHSTFSVFPRLLLLAQLVLRLIGKFVNKNRFDYSIEFDKYIDLYLLFVCYVLCIRCMWRSVDTRIFHPCPSRQLFKYRIFTKLRQFYLYNISFLFLYFSNLTWVLHFVRNVLMLDAPSQFRFEFRFRFYRLWRGSSPLNHSYA